MSKWDGRFRRVKRIYAGGKWIPRPRCRAVVPVSGGGYPGTHQCTLTARVVVNNRALCHTHLRQHLRQRALEDRIAAERDAAAVHGQERAA